MNNQDYSSSETDVMRTFFGAYFHQDWLLEEEDADSVINTFIHDNTVDNIRALQSALEKIILTIKSDNEIEVLMRIEYGSYYMPSGSSISAKQWLNDLINKLMISS